MKAILLETTVREDFKIDGLADRLEIDRQLALGKLVDLWTWVAHRKDEHDLADGITPRDIERAAKWQGKPGAFIDAALAEDLLEPMPDGMYAIHAWAKHCKHYRQARERLKRFRSDKEKKEIKKEIKVETQPERSGNVSLPSGAVGQGAAPRAPANGKTEHVSTYVSDDVADLRKKYGVPS